MRTKSCKYLLGMAAAMSMPFLASANLVVNGSFELGSFTDNTGQDTMNLGVGSTAMTGWTVTTAALAWIGPANPFGLSAADGSYFLDLSGYHDNEPYAGVAATTFTTVSGQAYAVSFEVGSSIQYDSTSTGVLVSQNGNSLGTFTTAAPTGQNEWQTFNLVFTATSASTALTFVGEENVDNLKYIGLDNVNVSAVPEPTTIISGALLLLPFGASTLRFVRKNRKV